MYPSPMFGRLGRVLVVTCLTDLSATAWALAQTAEAPQRAADSPAAEVPQSPSRGAGTESRECYPACRQGYLCSEGRCISMCNPACGAGEVCIDGVRCELQTSNQSIYEPPPPPPPEPTPFGKRAHSGLAFHIGFPGDITGSGSEEDLDYTLGLNIRSDFPIAQYVLIGPMFEFGAWRPEPGESAPMRAFYFDIDLFVRGRIPFDLDPVDLQLWAGVPGGLSLSFLNEEIAPNLEGFGVGWNIGALLGGAIHFTDEFGLLLEGGWIRHRLGHKRDPGDGNAQITFSSFVMNTGFIFGY